MNKLDQILLIILKVCAAKIGKEVDTYDLNILKQHTEDSKLWESLYYYLALNKMIPLVFYNFSERNLVDLIPSTISKKFLDYYFLTGKINLNNFSKVDKLLHELKIQNVTPAIWKGAALATGCYPNVYSREMGDIDFYLERKDRKVLEIILHNLGFSRDPSLNDNETEYNCVDHENTKYDFHFSCDFFKDHRPSLIYGETVNDKISTIEYFTFEPNAFLAFLIEHQRAHLPFEGISYRFFFDLMYLYEKYQQELDINKLSKFLVTDINWVTLHRSNLFLKEIAPDTKIPFIELAEGLSAFTLSEIRRSSLLGQWRLLSRYKSHLRVILSRFGLAKKRYKITPNLNDILLGTLDRYRHRNEIIKYTRKN